MPVAPPKKKHYQDHFVGYAALIVFVLLAAAFGALWAYLRSAPSTLPRVAYVDTGPLVVTMEGYTVSTRLSVQTSQDDAEWARKNRAALIGAMQQALAQSDPRRMQHPAELEVLQTSLKRMGNNALHTAKIQDVLLTEFVIQEAQ